MECLGKKLVPWDLWKRVHLLLSLALCISHEWSHPSVITPFLQSIYLSSLFLSCPSFSLSFIQVDKLDASESLRKEEEQLTEAQPIVYGRTPTLPLHLRKKNFYNSTTNYWLSNMVFIWLIQISRSHLFILLIFYFRFYFKLF